MTRMWLGSLLLAAGLCACDPQGLDLYSPVNARDYARSCARSQTDDYCQALLPTLAATAGPVTILMPNDGDTEITAHLARVLSGRGLTTEAFRRDPALQAAFARANIFATDRLTTGVHRTLDGVPHDVQCRLAGSGTPQDEICQIGPLSGVNRLQHLPAGSGSVYATTGASRADLPFFPF